MPQNDEDTAEYYDITCVVKDWLKNSQGFSEETKEELIEKFTTIMQEKNEK